MHMWIYGIGTLVIIVIYFSFSIASRNKYGHIVKEFKEDYPLMFMAPASLHIMATFRIMERLHSQISIIQQKMISIYGSRDSLKHTKIFVAQLLSVSLVCLLGAFLVPLLGDGDDVLFFAGLVFTFMIPALQVNSLSKKEKERKQAILLELPEVVNKIILLINAGETVQQALIRCVELKYKSESPLYDELTIAVNRLTSNEPFALVMNEFSKKCSIQEVSIFTTTVLLNYRKGGQDLILSLRELSHELWEKRKNISKIKGEEASSKLVFPLIFIFVAVMIIVGYPAITIL